MIDPATHTVSCDTPVISALARLNALPGGMMTLFVTDATGKVLGALTDGDIRRGLLRGASVSDPVSAVMHTGFLAFRNGAEEASTLGEARRRGIRLIPRLDAGGRLDTIIDTTVSAPPLPLLAVLMAGGRGERLRPLTLSTPKPLLKVGGRPIIDYNVDSLRKAGIRRLYVTVNYLHEQIEAHFASDPDTTCVLEPCRLGTLGSLSLIDPIDTPDVLVMNSDLLTSLDFAAMYRSHRSTGADITMAVTNYTVSVPFAIVETAEDRVVRLAEKPTYNYFANAGVYILKRDLLCRLPKGEYTDAPDFVAGCLADGLDVRTFPVAGTWIDIGSPDDFRCADELMARSH